MFAIINDIIAALGSTLRVLILLLPLSPFQFITNIDNGFIQNINYVLPFASAVTHLELYLSAVVIYYGLRIVLKWIKAAGN